jgi:hypothetical protein
MVFADCVEPSTLGKSLNIFVNLSLDLKIKNAWVKKLGA